MNAFQTIPFGASYDDVINELRETLGQEKISEYNGLVLIDEFSLGEISVGVIFHFDHKNRLYSLSFDTQRLTANKLDSIVQNEADYLTKVFRNKYGRPSHCYKPAFYNINDGYVSYMCRWQNKNLEIYTGLTVNDALYFARGIVTSRQLENAFDSYKKETERKKVEEGAKSF